MGLLLQMAWRNIWRQRRRSLLTAGAMSLGLIGTSALICISDGAMGQMMDVLVNQQTGHVQLHNPDYPTRRSIYDTIPDAEELLTEIEALDRVEGTTARLNGAALLGGEARTTGVQLLGVEPRREAKMAQPSYEDGRALAELPAHEIVLGEGLAETLEVQVGDEVVAVTQSADGSMGNELYTVVGVMVTGNPALDAAGALMHLADLQELMVLPDQVHEVLVVGALAEEQEISALRAQVAGAVDEHLLVRPWWEIAREAADGLAMQQALFSVFVAFVFALAGLGVVNTLLMSVFERSRELGVLRAVGMKPRELVAMILLEATMLAFLAALMGGAVALALDLHLVINGVDFSAGTGERVQKGMFTLDPIMHGKLSWHAAIKPLVGMFTFSVLAAVWPALRAARLRPVDAIREG